MSDRSRKSNEGRFLRRKDSEGRIFCRMCGQRPYRNNRCLKCLNVDIVVQKPMVLAHGHHIKCMSMLMMKNIVYSADHAVTAFVHGHPMGFINTVMATISAYGAVRLEKGFAQGLRIRCMRSSLL